MLKLTAAVLLVLVLAQQAFPKNVRRRSGEKYCALEMICAPVHTCNYV